MTLKKIKLVVSDFHLGKGRFLEDGAINTLEDYFVDEKFVEFLQYYTSEQFRKIEVELILNGDLFNLLQIDLREEFPQLIDEDIALSKMEKIVWGHRQFFEALSEFAARPKKSVTVIVGNHDPGLLFAKVKNYLKTTIGGDVYFPGLTYIFDGVHVEHGCQLQASNAFNVDKFYLNRPGDEKPILNLPWGSEFVIRFLHKVKRIRPYIDKIKPFRRYVRWAIVNDTGFAVRAIFAVGYYFTISQVAKFFSDPSEARRLLNMIRTIAVSPELDGEVKTLFEKNKELHTVITGHTHEAKIVPIGPGRVYINTGTWNDLITLGIDSPGRYLQMTYAEIRYTEGPKPVAHLKEWRGQWREWEMLNF